MSSTQSGLPWASHVHPCTQVGAPGVCSDSRRPCQLAGRQSDTRLAAAVVWELLRSWYWACSLCVQTPWRASHLKTPSAEHLHSNLLLLLLCCPACCTGVTWKAQNQAAVLLAAGQKGHRYTFPHAKISTAPPIMNRVFGQAVDAQLQVRRPAHTHTAAAAAAATAA